jgi:peptide/nickel transport system permease protein
LGIYLALHKNKFIDRLMLPAMYFVDTIPYFWLAMIFILVFAVELRVLPAGQAYTMYPTPTSILGHMILPVLTVVIGSLFHHAIVVRSSAIDIISSDFVQVMKAQGLRRRTFLGRVLRNSLLPSLTQLFLSMGLLIGGIFTIEYAFSYPGLGMVIADAALNRDYPVLQAALYLTTLVVLLSNLLADLTYPLADPRVSYVG